jgi:hypothetical protein
MNAQVFPTGTRYSYDGSHFTLTFWIWFRIPEALKRISDRRPIIYLESLTNICEGPVEYLPIIINMSKAFHLMCEFHTSLLAS